MCDSTIHTPQSKMPISTPTDNFLIAAKDLIAALKPPSHIIAPNIQKNHLQALKQLTTIFHTAVTTPITSTPETATPEIDTSTTIIKPIITQPEPIITQPVTQTPTLPHNNLHQIPFQ